MSGEGKFVQTPPAQLPLANTGKGSYPEFPDNLIVTSLYKIDHSLVIRKFLITGYKIWESLTPKLCKRLLH